MANFTTQQCSRCGQFAPRHPPPPICIYCGYTPEQAEVDRRANFQRQQQMGQFADQIASREDQYARRRHHEYWGPTNDMGMSVMVIIGALLLVAAVFGALFACGPH